MPVLLEVRDIYRRCENGFVFALPRLELETGHAYALTGPHGVGTTTLLRVLAGLDPAKMAHFRLRGASLHVDPYPPWLRREIFYVQQQHLDQWNLSAVQKQRAAIAQARALGASIILIDMPDNVVLRSQERREIIRVPAEARSEHNCVVLACTEEEAHALSTFTKLRLEKGKVTASLPATRHALACEKSYDKQGSSIRVCVDQIG
jgi:ABC-type lipoprotein export system ATPase subunit